MIEGPIVSAIGSAAQLAPVPGGTPAGGTVAVTHPLMSSEESVEWHSVECRGWSVCENIKKNVLGEISPVRTVTVGAFMAAKFRDHPHWRASVPVEIGVLAKGRRVYQRVLLDPSIP